MTPEIHIGEKYGFRQWCYYEGAPLVLYALNGGKARWDSPHGPALSWEPERASCAVRIGKEVDRYRVANEGHPAHPPEESPKPSCTCGYHFLKQPYNVIPTDARIFIHTGDGRADSGLRIVLGLCRGWGRVVPHQKGYRAEFIRPVRLYALVPDQESALRSICEMYGCELGRLPELRADAIKYSSKIAH